MKQELTTKQAEVYRYLTEYFVKNDQLPPMLSIAMRFSFGPNAAACHMKSIAAKGWIEKNEAEKYRFVIDRKLRDIGKGDAGPWFEQYIRRQG